MPQCVSIDWASVVAADKGTGIIPVSDVRCGMPVVRVIILKLAEDMFIPLPSCVIHYNAFIIAIQDNTVHFDGELFEDK